MATLRAVDPERVDLAASAPDAGGGTGHDPAGVVADEDPELFLFARPDGGDGGGGEFVLEQRQVARIRVVLDDEVIRAAHGRFPG